MTMQDYISANERMQQLKPKPMGLVQLLLNIFKRKPKPIEEDSQC